MFQTDLFTRPTTGRHFNWLELNDRSKIKQEDEEEISLKDNNSKNNKDKKKLSKYKNKKNIKNSANQSKNYQRKKILIVTYCVNLIFHGNGTNKEKAQIIELKFIMLTKIYYQQEIIIIL